MKSEARSFGPRSGQLVSTIIAMSYALKHRGGPVGIGAASAPHRRGVGAASAPHRRGVGPWPGGNGGDGGRMCRMAGRRRGFSMIELMVVIGVIAILVAILLPVLRAANESARQVRCASQLRQIGQAVFAYAANNRGMTPPWGGAFRIDDSDSPLSRGWIAMLWRYSGVKADSPLYHCPSFPVDDSTVTYFMSGRWTRLQTPEARSIALGRVRLSSAFLLVAETTAAQAYIPPFGTSNDPIDNTDKDDSGTRDLIFFGEAGGYNMHRNGNNVLFADGHVAVFRKHDPQAITYSPDRMENWDEVTGE
jgi:prepilin-type N-terminal cleavage/methylation domain-containing protein/prepilin-type processing-associated H-X9-DG protein